MAEAGETKEARSTSPDNLSFPEAFFDALVFIVPPIVGMIGGLALAMRSNPWLPDFLVDKYRELGTFSEKALLAVPCLALIYAIGLWLESASHLTLFSLTAIVARVLKHPSYFYSDAKKGSWQKKSLREKARESMSLFENDVSLARRDSPDLGVDLNKRYARLLLSKSLGLVCVLLTAASFWIGDRAFGFAACFVSVVSIVDMVVRRCWLNLEVAGIARSHQLAKAPASPDVIG